MLKGPAVQQSVILFRGVDRLFNYCSAKHGKIFYLTRREESVSSDSTFLEKETLKEGNSINES